VAADCPEDESALQRRALFLLELLKLRLLDGGELLAHLDAELVRGLLELLLGLLMVLNQLLCKLLDLCVLGPLLDELTGLDLIQVVAGRVANALLDMLGALFFLLLKLLRLIQPVLILLVQLALRDRQRSKSGQRERGNSKRFFHVNTSNEECGFFEHL